MRVIKGNLWDFGPNLAITTNGTVRKDGGCVMGRGVALQCKNYFPGIEYYLGRAIIKNGNIPQCFSERIWFTDDKWFNLWSFPVKHSWWEKADPDLIADSAKALSKIFAHDFLYLPWPGIGNGKLEKELVRSIIEPILDDSFVVVELE